ncbi:ABC transporter substrate-binding protein [Trueperella abortisuis]|uniref:Iron complex transport system substrate-binding protein n=1 Tax=Trueperella abortisuis TaxID=445930 RepID=A0ABT9PGR9_9ACTO|nr:ABC transporter substrate-binding protein [Trueperella abortisuis]MDP9831677.1 iron complex transport system substrate-binding protein [Trueperella abortisuis]
MMKKLLAAAAVLALAACSQAPAGSGASETASSAATPSASATATPSATPADEVSAYHHIVATSPETSDMALMLAGPENVAVISASSLSPMGQNPELARQVPERLETGINPDAEQILSYNPDLVVMTTRFDSETGVVQQLRDSGVEVLDFDGHEFDTPELYAEAVKKMGEKLGMPATAAGLTNEFLGRIAQVDADLAKIENKKSPAVLELIARGGKVMAMGANNVVPGLAIRAGATDAGAAAGITRTMPIDAETLLLANPDILFVEDFRGSGLEPFQDLLDNPALADVPAIKNGRVVLLPMNEASSTAGLQMYKGYATIAAEVQK